MSYSAEENFDKGYRAGYKKGFKIGYEKTKKQTIAAVLRDGRISPEQIAASLGVPLEDVLRIKEKIRA